MLSLSLLLSNEWFFYSTWQPSCLVVFFHVETSGQLIPAAELLKLKVQIKCQEVPAAGQQIKLIYIYMCVVFLLLYVVWYSIQQEVKKVPQVKSVTHVCCEVHC